MERTEAEKACKFSRVRLGHYLDEGGGAGQINRQAETELLTSERKVGILVVKRDLLIFKNPEVRGLFD
jgi:hypothetical protein